MSDSTSEPRAGGQTGSPSEVLQQDETQAYTYVTAAFYAALVVGIGVTALLHDALAPSTGFGASPGATWTTSAQFYAPIVAGAAGFYAGNDLDGQRAYLSSFVGNAVGYLILFLGAYMINDVLLDLGGGDIEIAMQVGIAAGIGVTGVLFAYVADNYEDYT
mgnify:CR=1 FL=1